ncbi:hypothetical protein BC937DRAFT_91690 [Endogone sp. FLAS-F59071]|nr:hypothetical protein BC937DRAFT_91690 [Endogone sp. FLAS-F59071]|eukprot:RUS16021.1 hypothetical protein BC937DRAFT_91690 [Endogone sp. FLAS-F59071]
MPFFYTTWFQQFIFTSSKAVTMPGKDDISEMEHTMRNIVPFLDATIGCDQECREQEQTLEPTAVRRNEGSDPNERARAGYKVDVIVEYQDLNWLPVIGCVIYLGATMTSNYNNIGRRPIARKNSTTPTATKSD